MERAERCTADLRFPRTQHIEKSQLHCENLARLRKEGRISATATPSAGVSTVTPASGVNAFAIDGLLGTASKLEEQLRNLKQQKEAAAEKKASPTTGAATTTGSSSLDALFAFENKMRSSSGGGGGATTGHSQKTQYALNELSRLRPLFVTRVS